MPDYTSIDLETLGRTEAYTLFITAIVPRPIGWLSTVSDTGLPNAAPFSWFNAVCGDPLMVMAAVGKRRGQPKDTTTNIRATGEFVVNVATADNAGLVVQSSADYAADVSEFDAVGLAAVPSAVVKPPRIAQSPVHLECVLEQIIALGRASTDLIIGRCVRMHVDPRVMAEDGRIDARKLRPLCRLGRDEYAVVDELIHYPRPPAP